MTSLGYSEWTATNTTSQKRIATIGKDSDKLSSIGSGIPMNNNDSPMLLIPRKLDSSSDQATHGSSETMNPDKINAILDKMNLEEQKKLNNPLADFEPIVPPENIVKINKTSNLPNSPIHPMYGGRAAAYTELANYQSIYTNNIPSYLEQQQKQQKGIKQSLSSPLNDRTLEKLNYLIHLLEQQQKEPTNNLLEDFLLYCLFGVFVIFVVDAFARYGKHVGSSSAKLRYKR